VTDTGGSTEAGGGDEVDALLETDTGGSTEADEVDALLETGHDIDRRLVNIVERDITDLVGKSGFYLSVYGVVELTKDEQLEEHVGEVGKAIKTLKDRLKALSAHLAVRSQEET
jgi:hypothetical protein